MKKVLLDHPRSAYTVANCNKRGKLINREFHVKRLQEGVIELFPTANHHQRNKQANDAVIERYVNNYHFINGNEKQEEEESLVLFFVCYNIAKEELQIKHHSIPFSVEKVSEKGNNQ